MQNPTTKGWLILPQATFIAQTYFQRTDLYPFSEREAGRRVQYNQLSV